MIWKRIKKTPSVIQMEAVECGAASLSMILGFYGRYVSLPQLREDCEVTRDGSSADGIIKAAKKYGLDAYMYTNEILDVKDIPTPFIAFWGFKHFVVIEGFRGNKVHINDPANGERVITEADFHKYFTGLSIGFKPNAEFKKGGVKKRFLPALLRRLKGHNTTLIFLVLTGIGLIFPNLLLPLFSKMFVDDYLAAHLQTWLMTLLFGMFITFLIQLGLSALQNYYLMRFQNFLALKMGSDFIQHVLKLPLSFFNLRSPGDVTQRFISCNGLAQLIAVYLIATLLSVFTALFYLVLMCFYSVSLALIGLAITLLNVFVMLKFSRQQINLNRNLAMDFGQLFGMSVNGLSAIEVYKSNASEGEYFAQWAGYFTKVMSGSQAAQRLSQVLLSINSLLVSSNLIVIVGLGGYFVMKGGMSLGMLVAFQTLLMSFMLPFNQLVQINSLLQQMEGNFNRIDDVLTYPVADAPTQPISNEEKIIGDLTVKNLVFGFNKANPPLFNGLNFELKHGKSLGVIGPPRFGATSLANLVVGLFEPWSGEILLDGKPINSYSQLVLARYVGYVGQQIALFGGDVGDNITLWDDNIEPREKIILAAKAACIHDVIAKREGAYNSPVLERGSNFSGGECQRIEIARALVRDPSLIVFDNATNSLDPPLEAQIIQNIKELGHSMLIMSQRLSSIRHCDEIIVLNQQGCVAEKGTHDELIAEGGLYAKFAR